MLARAAGRKARKDTSQIPATFANQLALPWLCPALTRQNSQRRRLQTSSSTTLIPATTTTTPRTPSAACTHETLRQSSRRRPSLSSRPRSRALATTAEASPPPAYNPHQHWAKQAQFNHASRLVSWDASNPLMIHDSLAAIPAVRKTFGMGSDPIELHQNLYACLRVGRLDRGAAILKRLMSLYKSSTPEATDAHNTYLQALFESSQHDPSEDPAKTVDSWYNKEMIDAGVQPNAHTYVTLLRTVMHHLEDDARDHAVREYLSEARARAPELVEEINGSPDFTDEEWDLLIRLQPETYEEPPSVQEVQILHVDSPTGRKNLINHGLVPTPAQPIRPIKQKGKGLDSLKQALAMFNDTESVPFPHDMEGTQEEKDQAYAYARQLHLERDSLKAAVERWKFENEKLQEIGIHGVLKTKSVQAYMYHWYSALVPLFRKQIEHARNILSAPAMENSRDDAQAYGAWLEKCTPETLAAMTVARCVQSSIRDSREDSISMKISALSTTLGQDIEDYLKAEATNRLNTFLKKQRKLTRRHLITKLSKIDTTPGTSPSSIRSTPLSADNIDIPLIVRTKLGAMCLELLLQSATITMTVNDAKTGKQVSHTTAAFSHQIGFFQGKKVGVLTPHHEVVRKLCTETVQDVSTVKLPMVVEPKAWAGFDEGAYYTTPSKVVRQKTPDISQRMYTHSAIENGDMNQVLAGLDVLGKVPWQINASLLEVMTQIWNSGDGVGALVGEKLSIERPSEPPADATFEQRFKWSKQLKEYENAKSGLHSQRCFVNSQLETARSFVNEKKIFFPHSVDFRGRAYPIPPILNHIGSDLARGLLQFANGKELGTVGLQWLKIHIANLYGFDKASLKEREQFAVDNMDEILDSASNPVEGRRWWTKAEDPWQCLACCMELGKAFSLPDPTRHVSQLPVHQDGTCNGLQHYAALGGDFAGARQVNLEPSDRPQDIYTGVAELVKEMVSTDAAKGNKIAALVDGYITRKVVKRTVMTNVYGVTFMGAKQQVLDELHNTFPNFQGTKDVPYLPSVALYVATKIFQALGKIFNGAQEIQYWLGECGDRITTSISAEQVKQIRKRFEGKKIDVYGGIYNDSRMSKTLQTKLLKGIETFRTSIIWTTPLKMPIVQPYRKDSTQKVKTKIQDITIMKKSNSDVVDKRKQLQAFPPNFIHSLDASHMILSALKCNELGLDFAAVHDSFWTHASDIPTLNTILRDAFVRMHSEDIVGRLHAEFTARYSGAMYRANVFTTSKAGLAICEWRRQQRRLLEKTPGSVVRSSTANWEEVALEAERQELLASEDVDARKKGEEMVTPTSIWMAYQDPKALYSTRMNLLGESRGKKRQDEVRDKVLSAEAEAMGAATCNAEPVPAVPTGEGMNDSKRVTPDTADELPRVHGKAATIDVWVPLTFPPVPEKGGWDVSRLRESKYFFS